VAQGALVVRAVLVDRAAREAPVVRAVSVDRVVRAVLEGRGASDGQGGLVVPVDPVVLVA
jgi:hypothetical protein